MNKLTDDVLNKRVHELMGLCLHRWKYEYKNDLYQCLSECKQLRKEPADIDFTTSWEGFGLMFKFMQKHEDFPEFLLFGDHVKPAEYCENVLHIHVSKISPRPFAEAMARFFDSKKEAKP